MRATLQLLLIRIVFSLEEQGEVMLLPGWLLYDTYTLSTDILHVNLWTSFSASYCMSVVSGFYSKHAIHLLPHDEGMISIFSI